MYDYELQQFELLAASVGGVSPLVLTNTRDQRRFVFNLDYNKPRERTLGQGLAMFRERRQMTDIIRNAVRLYFDLSAGNTAVLCELFPGIVSAIQSQAAQPAQPVAMKPVMPAPAGDDDSALLSIKKTDPAESKASANFLDSAFSLLG